jgi:hypothetical protein
MMTTMTRRRRHLISTYTRTHGRTPTYLGTAVHCTLVHYHGNANSAVQSPVVQQDTSGNHDGAQHRERRHGIAEEHD